MKLGEIYPLFEAIYDTPEYQLSDKEKRDAAFLAKAPALTGEEILELYGVEMFPPFTVTTNLGNSITFTPEFENQHGFPVLYVRPHFPIKSVLDKETGRYVDAYVVGGTTPSRPGFEYVPVSMVVEKLKPYRETFHALVKRYHDEFEEKLRVDLEKALPPLAKAALNDNLLKMINERDTQGLYDWFKSHGFKMRGSDEFPPLDAFEKMTSLAGMNISTRRAYRAAEGTNLMIDWKNGEFYYETWSSDD